MSGECRERMFFFNMLSRDVLNAAVARVSDVLLTVFVVPAGVLLRTVRRVGLHRLPLCRRSLVALGVLPIRRHYYEPFTTNADLRHPPSAERTLPGVNWNASGQTALLDLLSFASELKDLTAPRTSKIQFRLGNGSFESGDAEFLYQMIRLKKPRRLYEIGSGNSTLMARRAISKNCEEDPQYSCKHLCIEPFEAAWLEAAGIQTLRQRVEEVDLNLFCELQRGDVLFIDSSHVIRPQGDVLTECLQILPRLQAGVVVHIHDIFSPRDYPAEWLFERMWLWNEQYLLEAFLAGNGDWQVLAAVNWLCHRDFDALRQVCPYLTPGREPGSFYIEKLR